MKNHASNPVIAIKIDDQSYVSKVICGAIEYIPALRIGCYPEHLGLSRRETENT